MKHGKYENVGSFSTGEEASADIQTPENGTEPAEQKRKKSNWQNDLLQDIHDLAYLMAAVLLVFLLCFRVVIVSGTSMEDTLIGGDYLLLLSNTFYHNPQPGDIVVVSKKAYKDGEAIVKRVIATEGQVVDIDFEAGIVYVDNVPLEEAYTKTPTNMDEGVSFPLTVEEGCIFVMGDYRNVSKDSRNPEIGLVDTREVLGHAVLLFFPGMDEDTKGRDFGRIGVLS